MKKRIAYGLWLLCAVLTYGQSHFSLSGNQSKKIRFQLLNNLIIVPVELNGIELSFIVDSGVSKVILFDIGNTDSLTIKDTEILKLRGLGDQGATEAIISHGNTLKIGNAINKNQSIYAVFDQNLNFTPRLGVPVHGILGYDLFKDFIIELNYGSKFLRLHQHQKSLKLSQKWDTIPISFHKNKPYLYAKIKTDSIPTKVKLLIDTGSSDALWLFENKAKRLTPNPYLYFEDYLGKGLSGSIYGKRSRMDNLSIGTFTHNNLNVAYPDSVCIELVKHHKERNGSIGGELLQRYHIFVNYKNQELYIKPNKHFNKPFTYNNSGIIIEQHGVRIVKEYKKQRSSSLSRSKGADFKDSNIVEANVAHYVLKPAFDIVEVRPGSNAALAGLLKGDLLLAINGKASHDLSLQNIVKLLHGKTGEWLKLTIERQGIEKHIKFQLDNVFQKKDPQQREGL